ncbi:MAG: aspartate kinase [Solobacterium sp.]|nr:aspartate kinase [Solobacterium sp.]
MIKTVKFGGTSLADAQMIRRCADIVLADDSRRYVIVSAPGKRSGNDEKVTDLLYALYAENELHHDTEPVLNRILARFADIVADLRVDFDLDAEFDVIRDNLKKGASRDYFASRGEYLNAKIFAAFIGRPFIDAANLIRFHDNRLLNEHVTYRDTAEMLDEIPYAVIPGFYGCDQRGNITTFTRGGSDVTGAIIARAIGADLYENWTDVDGIMSADPRIIDNPKKIDVISYRELRELSYMGASVLHEDAVLPVRKVGIPIQLRNTMNPEAAGTMIVSRTPAGTVKHAVTGIAGKKGFSNLQVESVMMNSRIGYGAKILQILADNGVSYEHTPTSIDMINVIAETAYLEKNRNNVVMEIDRQLHPDRVFIEDGIALTAVVGEGISGNVGVAARVLQCIAEAGISIRMVDAGFSELNILIGVSENDYERTLQALYKGLLAYI